MVTAREIIEALCEEGDNAWQTGILGLHAQLRVIMEAWTAGRKSEIVSQMQGKAKIIDHAVFKDYDLVLWEVNGVAADLSPTGTMYAVSLNSGQENPTDPDTQRVKFPGTAIGHVPGSSMVEVLKKWVDEYGRIAIGTVALNRLNIYRKILSRFFKINDIIPGEPDRGFYIL